MMISFLDLIVVAVVVLYYLRKIGSREPSLPPGPPTFPVIGNAHQLPKTRFWLQ